MPTYEYRCSKGHAFELFQKMSDLPAGTCPECGSPAERVVSGGAGFVFKGAGFYITDYRSDDYKKRAQTETPGGETKPGSSKGDASGQGDASAASGKKPDKPEKKADTPAKPSRSSGDDA